MKLHPTTLFSFAPLAAGVALAACHGAPGVRIDAAPSASPPAANVQDPQVPPAHGYEQDPAYLRREILKRLDAHIDEAATRAHLEARLSLDEAMPIPYLGVDAEPANGGMQLTAVYGATGAEAAGLKVGDVLWSIDGERTDGRPALAHAIRSKRAGTMLHIELRRDGAPRSVDCLLSQRPEEDEDEAEQFPDLPQHITAITGPFASDFERDDAAGDVAGFDLVLGGHGAPSHWVVGGDAGARCLRQASEDRTGIHFPMAIAHEFFGDDVAATARMRYVGGKVDRAGGIVLRYRDPGNYYVARVNAAEGDLRIFRVANGIRRTLPGGIVKAPTDDGAWHTLEFRIQGSVLTATLDGAHTATAYDSYFLKGRAGLWTKSDSLTEFDDVAFVPIAKER